ncbi:hypothetical protein [Cellulomonas endometrii]|uniref:hypothetical protein n=1 Tax=Cellulomonas endometrii TaxID=3036301 RepID=UPI0024ADC650|nr:hypothetical protein [Cellulomonas endometrii]
MSAPSAPTGAAPSTLPDDLPPTGDTGDTVPAGRRRPTTRSRRLTGALVAVAVLVAGIGVAQHRSAAAAEREAAAALADLGRAGRELRAARYAGRDALAAAAHRVADNAVREDLAGLLVALPAATVPPGDPAAARTASARAQAAAAVERTGLLTAATRAVRRAQAEWELARATADHAGALAALDAALHEGAAALAASAGRVPDEAPRQALAAAIDAATADRDAPVPVDVEALGRAAAQAAAHTEALAVARAALAAAEATWQAEQDRIAAEAAAARRRSASGSSGGATSVRGRVGVPPSAPGSRTAPATPTAPGTTWSPGDPLPEGWTVVTETEGGGWCGDEHGNVWDC